MRGGKSTAPDRFRKAPAWTIPVEMQHPVLQETTSMLLPFWVSSGNRPLQEALWSPPCTCVRMLMTCVVGQALLGIAVLPRARNVRAGWPVPANDSSSVGMWHMLKVRKWHCCTIHFFHSVPWDATTRKTQIGVGKAWSNIFHQRTAIPVLHSFLEAIESNVI